eukprot:8884672-Heterocapsa_arctica.AAC.1
MCNLCKVLVPYSDLHVFYMNEEDLQISHGLIQYYVKLDEMAKNHNFSDQIKMKIVVKNGLEIYSFMMCNTLNEETLKEKFEGEDKEMINLVSTRRSTSTATSSSRSSSRSFSSACSWCTSTNGPVL